MLKPQQQTVGTLIIVSGPSGAGKTSLVAHIVQTLPQIRISISHTTRKPRKTEKEGENYYFVDQQTFDKMLKNNDFLESAEVFGHHYGTRRTWIEQQLAQGTHVILEIDWQGAAQVRKQMPQAISIFILPPNIGTLKTRLQSRKQDNAAIIQTRTAQAMEDISHYSEYDYIIINSQFEQALSDLSAIINAQNLTLEKQSLRHAKLLAELQGGQSKQE